MRDTYHGSITQPQRNLNALAWAVAVVALGLTGCATVPMPTSPEETAFLAEVVKESPDFDVDNARADEAWSRAQAFVAQRASMKIQTATDYVLETYTPQPDAFNPGYGYRVTRAKTGDKTKFTVLCFNGNVYTPGQLAQLPARNTAMLARYIRTGELKYPGLIAR